MDQLPDSIVFPDTRFALTNIRRIHKDLVCTFNFGELHIENVNVRGILDLFHAISSYRQGESELYFWLPETDIVITCRASEEDGKLEMNATSGEEVITTLVASKSIASAAYRLISATICSE